MITRSRAASIVQPPVTVAVMFDGQRSETRSLDAAWPDDMFSRSLTLTLRRLRLNK